MKRQPPDDSRTLAENELFEGLTPEELSLFTPLCFRFAVVEDGMVFAEGREASNLYLVAEGQIALQKGVRAPHGRHSRRTTIAMCRPGEVVGWSALVAPHRYTLSAVAWQSSKLVRMDSKLLRRVLDQNHDTGYKVIRDLSIIMARRLRQITQVLISERQNALAGLKPGDSYATEIEQLLHAAQS